MEKETNDNIRQKREEWFELTWKQLPTFLFTSQTKGSKKMALDELKKLKPDEETLNAMAEWLKRKEEIDLQLRNGQKFVAPWPHFCRMIKREFWNDDLPVIKHKKKASTNKCECGQDIDHAGYRLCWNCYNRRFGNSMCGYL